jgi:hypothetical protein
MIVDKIMTHKVITIALKYLCFGVNFVYNYKSTNEFKKQALLMTTNSKRQIASPSFLKLHLLALI